MKVFADVVFFKVISCKTLLGVPTFDFCASRVAADALNRILDEKEKTP
jgi:hypothetical protein